MSLSKDEIEKLANSVTSKYDPDVLNLATLATLFAHCIPESQVKVLMSVVMASCLRARLREIGHSGGELLAAIEDLSKVNKTAAYLNSVPD